MKKRYGFIIILLTSSFLLSCDLMFDIINDAAFLNGLSVSKGSYTNCIVLNWRTDSYYSSSDESYSTADSYYVTKYADTLSGIVEIDGFYSTSNRYEDYDVEPGEIYYYRVESLGENFGNRTNRSWGYALNSTDLEIWDQEGDSILLVETPVGSDDDSWFQFNAREGFIYHFHSFEYSGIGGSSDLDVTLTLYQDYIRDEDILYFSDGDGFGHLDWTCSESGRYYLKTTEATGAYFQLTSWFEQIPDPAE